MKKLKITIFALALIFTAGVTYAGKIAAPNDCSVEPGGPGTLNSSDCQGKGVKCCYLISNNMEIQKAN